MTDRLTVFASPFYAIPETGESILTIYMSYDVFMHKKVPFLDRDVTAQHFWVKSPYNSIWGVNRQFQAKHVKYQPWHIIETTASIPTKFCT